MMENSKGEPVFVAKELLLKALREPEASQTLSVSLRDYFAGLAMQSMFTRPGARMVADRDQRYDETNWAYIVATNAYDMADEMLKVSARVLTPYPGAGSKADEAAMAGERGF